MPVKPEAVAAYLGLDLEKIEDEKAMKSAFDAAFLRRDVAHEDRGIQDRVFGKINAIARQRLKSGAKSLGVDLGNVDEGDPLDLIPKFSESVQLRIDAIAKERDDLKASAGKGDNTEALTALQKERDALVKERDAFGNSAKEWETKYTSLDSTWKKREHETKLSGFIDAAKARVKFRDDVNEFTKKGFINDFLERHTLDLSGEKPKVLDNAGQIVLDKQKAQTFASLEDLLSEAAEAAKLTVTAPQGGTPVKKTVATMSAGGQRQQDPAHPGARRTREVAQRF
jgi:hypothetical protein